MRKNQRESPGPTMGLFAACCGKNRGANSPANLAAMLELRPKNSVYQAEDPIRPEQQEKVLTAGFCEVAWSFRPRLRRWP